MESLDSEHFENISEFMIKKGSIKLNEYDLNQYDVD